MAVLDIKGAYKSVHCGLLIEVLGKRIRMSLGNMIDVLLAPVELRTVGN